MVAISIQLGDPCRKMRMLKRVGGKMAGVWTMLLVGANYRALVSCRSHGVFGIIVSLFKAPNKCVSFNIILHREVSKCLLSSGVCRQQYRASDVIDVFVSRARSHPLSWISP